MMLRKDLSFRLLYGDLLESFDCLQHDFLNAIFSACGININSISLLWQGPEYALKFYKIFKKQVIQWWSTFISVTFISVTLPGLTLQKLVSYSIFQVHATSSIWHFTHLNNFLPFCKIFSALLCNMFSTRVQEKWHLFVFSIRLFLSLYTVLILNYNNSQQH